MNSSPEASHTNTKYRNKWEFSINEIIKKKPQHCVHVVTRPNVSTRSFIGLIVFTTACYFILRISFFFSLCVFNSFILLVLLSGQFFVVVVGFSYIILNSIYISCYECLSYIHQPQTVHGQILKYNHTLQPCKQHQKCAFFSSSFC